MKILFRKINSFFKTFLLYTVFRHWAILGMIYKNLRPNILMFCGAKVGRNAYFANGIYIDNNAHLLEFGDNILVAPNVQFLFHMRDMSNYNKGTVNRTLKHIHKKTIIGNGVSIGMGSIILPGVKIGNGAVIAAGTLVNKDVPAWHLVAGNPMKIIKEYKPDKDEY